jgi:hypothetical protein
MQSTPKRRGRPKGTGIDDQPMLARIADRMIANPGLKPTTAMKMIEPELKDDETKRRRLQSKWQCSRVEQLKAAQDRAAEKSARSNSTYSNTRGAGIAAQLTVDWAMQAALDRSIRERVKTMTVAREIENIMLENARIVAQTNKLLNVLYIAQNGPVAQVARMMKNHPSAFASRVTQTPNITRLLDQ